jgi:ArsR family transcriptional regulator, arsenate/arsenite/antimonite-responsive transcriptional repressor
MNRRVGQFGALGQEDRLRIFRLLVRAGLRGKCVDEVKRALKMPGSTLSHHLDTLTRSGLCTAQRSGRFIYYAVNWRETSNLIRFLSEDCCAEMHTRLVPPAAKACGSDGGGCSAEEEPAISRAVRDAAKQ